MVEAAHRGALDRRAERAVRIDFDHPAVALLVLGRVEVVVRAFFAGQVGAPRRMAARAVVEHADHGRAYCRSGWAAHAVQRVAGVALVVDRVALDLPLAAGGQLDLDHRDADCRQRDALLLRRGAARGVGAAGEQDVVVRQFVVDGEQPALLRIDARQREEVHAVMVAAGLALGFGRGLEGAGIPGGACDPDPNGRRIHIHQKP